MILDASVLHEVRRLDHTFKLRPIVNIANHSYGNEDRQS